MSFDQKGFSVISAVLAIGIISVVVTVLSQIIVNGVNSAARMERVGNVSLIRTEIMSSLSAVSSCSPNISIAGGFSKTSLDISSDAALAKERIDLKQLQIFPSGQILISQGLEDMKVTPTEIYLQNWRRIGASSWLAAELVISFDLGETIGVRTIQRKAHMNFSSKVNGSIATLTACSTSSDLGFSGLVRSQVFKTPGVSEFVVPDGVFQVVVEVWGGGGGGGGASWSSAAGLSCGGGGAGSGSYIKHIVSVEPGSVLETVVGKGGVGGRAGGDGVDAGDGSDGLASILGRNGVHLFAAGGGTGGSGCKVPPGTTATGNGGTGGMIFEYSASPTIQMRGSRGGFAALNSSADTNSVGGGGAGAPGGGAGAAQNLGEGISPGGGGSGGTRYRTGPGNQPALRGRGGGDGMLIIWF